MKSFTFAMVRYLCISTLSAGALIYSAINNNLDLANLSVLGLILAELIELNTWEYMKHDK